MIPAVSFDWSVNLGHIGTALFIVVGAITQYSRLSSTLERVTQHQEAASRKLDEVTGGLGQVTYGLTELKKDVQAVQKDVTGIEQRVNTLANDHGHMRERVAALEVQTAPRKRAAAR